MEVEIFTGHTRIKFYTNRLEYGERDIYGLIVAYVNNDCLIVKYMTDDPNFYFGRFNLEPLDEVVKHDSEDDDFFDGFPEPVVKPSDRRSD